jgi:ribosomal protein S18 acetylase RimI-like enzyme
MGEIYIIAVDPEQQRRGVASALMDHAMSQMRQAGMDIVMVETGDDPGHAASRATYERAGFQRWPVARYFLEL